MSISLTSRQTGGRITPVACTKPLHPAKECRMASVQQRSWTNTEGVQLQGSYKRKLDSFPCYQLIRESLFFWVFFHKCLLLRGIRSVIGAHHVKVDALVRVREQRKEFNTARQSHAARADSCTECSRDTATRQRQQNRSAVGSALEQTVPNSNHCRRQPSLPSLLPISVHDGVRCWTAATDFPGSSSIIMVVTLPNTVSR